VAVGLTELGKMIRRKRKALNWTQEQLAAKARMDKQYLSRIETGIQQPSLNILDKIAKAFESELQIDRKTKSSVNEVNIPLKKKTEQQQALDELMSTVKDKSADYIKKITKAIKAIES
jgi:transcriptional regulator with XRE-family HTH domain